MRQTQRRLVEGDRQTGEKERPRGQEEGRVWGGGRDRQGEGQSREGEARSPDSEAARLRPNAGLGARHDRWDARPALRIPAVQPRDRPGEGRSHQGRGHAGS